MYGKIINGNLHRAPAKLAVGDTVVYNPTDEQLRSAGYKPVEHSGEPYDAPEGQHWESAWAEQDNVIVLDWHLVDDPTVTDIDAEEALSIILGGAGA